MLDSRPSNSEASNEKDGRSKQSNLLRQKDPLITSIGAGGGGSWACLALAAAGVRRFRILDMDRVEATNLNRQVAFCPADIGRPKIDVLAERLKTWVGAEVETFDQRIEEPEDAAKALSGADFAVCAVDLPLLSIHKIMTEALHQARTPGFFIGHGLPVNRIGPTVLPQRPGCPDCFREADMHHTPWMRRNHDYGSYMGTALSACFSVISAHLVEQVTQLVTGQTPSLWQAYLQVDFSSWEHETRSLENLELCETCRSIEKQSVNEDASKDAAKKTSYATA